VVVVCQGVMVVAMAVAPALARQHAGGRRA